MSLTKASSRVDESIWTSRAVTPAVGQGEDHRVDQLSGPGDDDVGAAAGDRAHLGKLAQQAVVEGGRGNEAHARPAAGPRGQAGRAVERDDMSGVDQGHPVAQPLGFLHEVRHQEDRHPAVPHALDEVPGVAPGLRIEPRRHLVEHGDLRPADQGQRDGQPLALAAGQGPVVVLALAGQTERVDQLPDVGRVASRRTGRGRGSPRPAACAAARSPGAGRRRSRADPPGLGPGPGPSRGSIPHLVTGGPARTRPWWSCPHRSGRGCRRSRPRRPRTTRRRPRQRSP